MQRRIFIITFILTIIAGVATHPVLAGSRFTSSYPCSDDDKICASHGMRIVDGFEVYKDCWEWRYSKSCNYPSKDNCRNYGHCYAVTNLPCLLHDNYGNCVNLQKEFSCKRWVPAELENQKVRMGLTAKDGAEGLVCKGIPCIDGNCVDKSYETNGEMMDAISKLYMVSTMKDAKDMNFQLFAGFSAHCSKKTTSYSNCCSVSMKGWGHNLGAKCTKDEQDLMARRKKNLCVYVGKQNKQNMGVTTVVKHHYCCFGNMLNKVMQVEGRKQLGLNFGSGGRPDCRGLTLAEIQLLDFNRMDFSEFIEDFKAKFASQYKAPNSSDLTTRVKGGLPDIRQYDGNSLNKENNRSGWSNKLPEGIAKVI